MATENFNDRYTYLTGMLNGCNDIIKYLDTFEGLLNKIIVGGNAYEKCNQNSVITQYTNIYGLRKTIFNYVYSYIGLYTEELQANYKDAMSVLNALYNELVVINSYKTLDSFTKPSPMWTVNGKPASYQVYFPTMGYDKILSVYLRDPISTAIKSLSNSSTSQSTSGGVVAPSSKETTNATARDLLNTALVRVKDPAVQSWINKDFTTKNIHDQAVARVADKKKEATIEMQILKKLGDSAFMSSIDKSTQGVQNFIKGLYNSPDSAKDYLSSWVGKYVFKNIMYGQIKIADPNAPQDVQLKSVLREQTRKKYPKGMLFCDEEMVNGNITLKKDAESTRQLDAANKAILNKMLNSKQ